MGLSTLKKYLISSIKKNGNQPLTLQHLVNIINLIEKEEEEKERILDKAYDEVFNDMHRYSVGD